MGLKKALKRRSSKAPSGGPTEDPEKSEWGRVDRLEINLRAQREVSAQSVAGSSLEPKSRNPK